MLPAYEEVTGNISALDAWERLRRHRTRAVVMRSVHIVIGLLIAAAGLLMLVFAMDAIDSSSGDDAEGSFAFFLFSICILIGSPLYILQAFRRTLKKFSRHYKQIIVPSLLKNMVKQASYPPELKNSRFRCSFDADDYISIDELLAFPLFRSLDESTQYKGEDFFTGTLGLTDFQLCEIFAQKVERDYENGNKVKTVLFQGLVLIADFHKEFEGTTVIESRKGRLSRKLTHDGKPMKTISHEFDKLFRVWTTDETTARYLLPVDMLERVVRLRRQFPKNSMSLCLHQGKLAIAIHRLDYFEARGIRKLEDTGIRHTYNEIRSILDIVDLLNLNTRIWNKKAT